jgi:hypothetical protein
MRRKLRFVVVVVPLISLALMIGPAGFPGAPVSSSTLVSALGRIVTAQMDLLTAPGAPPDVLSGTFPGRGDDSAPSLGTFTVFINPSFRPLLAGYPGYDTGLPTPWFVP